MPNSEDWRAVGNAQESRGVGVGGSSVDFFVGVCDFESVIVLQDGKKRDPVQRCVRQAGKILSTASSSDSPNALSEISAFMRSSRGITRTFTVLRWMP